MQNQQPPQQAMTPEQWAQYQAGLAYGDAQQQLMNQGALVQQGVNIVDGAQAMAQVQSQSTWLKLEDPDLHYPGGTGQKQGITIFLFGAPGTWKTTFAGQFPKVLFLSVGAEGGDDALAMLPSIYGVPAPPSFHITAPDMMHKKIEMIRRNYKQMGVNTIVVDSVTYYVDMWIAQLMAMRYKDPKIRAKIEKEGGDATNMTMRDWGLLGMHMRDLAMLLHNTPLNVIWIALEKEIKESDGQGGGSRTVAVEPYIRGETAIKLPGMCKMIIHAHKELKPDPNVMGRMMIQPTYYTSPNYLTKMLRHKYGNAFPEGKLIDPNYGEIPTFNSIWSRIGNFVYVT
jgi:hypothetical protein